MAIISWTIIFIFWDQLDLFLVQNTTLGIRQGQCKEQYCQAAYGITNLGQKTMCKDGVNKQLFLRDRWHTELNLHERHRLNI